MCFFYQACDGFGYKSNVAEACVHVEGVYDAQDDCLSNNGGCDPLTQCINSPAGPTCGPCPRGYSGTGKSGCVEIIQPSCFAGVLPGTCINATDCTNPGSQVLDGLCPNEAHTGKKCCVESYDNYSNVVDFFVDVADLDEFNEKRDEAKEWFRIFLWPLLLENVKDIITKPLDFDIFFDGFVEASFTNMTNIDKDELDSLVGDLLPDQRSLRELGICPDDIANSLFPDQRDLQVLDDKDEELRSLGSHLAEAQHDIDWIMRRHRQLFITEDGCIALVIETAIDILALVMTVFGVQLGPAKTAMRKIISKPSLGPAFTVTMMSYKVFDKKFLVDLLVVLFTSVSFHDIAGAFKSSLTELTFGVLFTLLLEWSSIYLSMGAYLVIKAGYIAYSACCIWDNIQKKHDACFEEDENCPSVVPIDVCAEIVSDIDRCTQFAVVCEGTEWVCKTETMSCPAGFRCNDGECKLIDDLVPCVAVIDEDASFGHGPQQEIAWNEFRERYPHRPFCLLMQPPGNNEKMSIPENFSNDGLITQSNIVRDDGDVSKASDWATLCGLTKFFAAGIGVDFVGLFIDDSGSLYESQVRASRDLSFLATLKLRASLSGRL